MFECDEALTGLRTAPDTNCPTGAGSVSDETCVPASTVVGYMGGIRAFPTYQTYTAGDNYSETLRLQFDGQQTSFAELLQVYWRNVPDPTAICQDPAYCLRIFYVDSAQREAAETSLAKRQSQTARKINVAILPASEFTFWRAEEYHQNYFANLGGQCVVGQHLPGLLMMLSVPWVMAPLVLVLLLVVYHCYQERKSKIATVDDSSYGKL